MEVFDGQFVIATGPGESVVVSQLDHEITISGGASLQLVGAEQEGIARVIAGTVTLLTNLGEEIVLNVGDEYLIKLTGALPGLPATAAGDPTGFGIGDDAPPADSTSIEAGLSPSPTEAGLSPSPTFSPAPT